MRRSCSLFLSVFLVTALPCAADRLADSPKITVSQIKPFFTGIKSEDNVFQLEGNITEEIRGHFIFQDGTGGLAIIPTCTNAWRRGDRVRLIASNRPNCFGEIDFVACAESITVLSHGTPPPLVRTTPAGIAAGRHGFQHVEIEGVVTAIFKDEIDSEWRVLFVEADGHRCIVMGKDDELSGESPNTLLDAEIRVDGICFPYSNGARHYLGPWIRTMGANSIRIIRNPPADPFLAEEFRDFDSETLSSQTTNAHRYRLSGTVVANWHESAFFLLTPNNHRVEIRMHPGSHVPRPGETVTAVGFIRKNAFFLWMDSAIVRTERNRPDIHPDEPQEIDPFRLFHDVSGKPAIDARLNGCLVRLTGIVRTLISVGTPQARLGIECSGEFLSAEIGGIPPPEIGSRIRIVGACRIAAESDTESSSFSRVKDVTVVLRSPQDLAIVEHPPFWTARRMGTLIGILSAGLLSIAIWNFLLTRAIARKKRELEDELIARIGSEFKVGERTRLAVELHDSIAQNLTGVALALDAATDAAQSAPPAVRNNLAVAARTLRSCRGELRNCLWDLRNNALETDDMNTAIQRTLAPHVGDMGIAIRFNVPRERFTDNTAHAVLCIIRELVLNAIHHGHATRVTIAGATEGHDLLFSVRDDGCGFDPTNCPSVEQGHFGLQGIAERVDNLNGEVLTSSSPEGTKISVRLRMPEEESQQS